MEVIFKNPTLFGLGNVIPSNKRVKTNTYTKSILLTLGRPHDEVVTDPRAQYYLTMPDNTSNYYFKSWLVESENGREYLHDILRVLHHDRAHNKSAGAVAGFVLSPALFNAMRAVLSEGRYVHENPFDADVFRVVVANWSLYAAKEDTGNNDPLHYNAQTYCVGSEWDRRVRKVTERGRLEPIATCPTCKAAVDVVEDDNDETMTCQCGAVLYVGGNIDADGNEVLVLHSQFIVDGLGDQAIISRRR
jgi:hypothetical protein